MYRPKFCADCGEKIFRMRWHWWTSRKFCARCAPRFRRGRLTRVAAAGVAVLLLGIAIGKSARPAPSVVIQRTHESAALAAPANADAGAKSRTGPVAAAEAGEVYMCGARTKKGTPCSRRVHGPVRCWQHKGMVSIIPVVPIK